MTKIGIIGGGQLGMMIAEAAKEMGVATICLDPAEDAPAFAVCDEAVVGSFDDVCSLEYLCQNSDVVCYEFENIPSELLGTLEQKYNIKQGFKPLRDSQDRLIEKQNAVQAGLRTPNFCAVDDEESLHRAVAQLGLPSVLKSRRFGYDGHGQMVLRSTEDVKRAVEMLSVPLILEQFIEFDFEISVVMVRSGDKIVTLPIGRNVHSGGILDLSIVPAEISDELLASVKRQSEEFMRRCDYEGILTIEYFVRGDEIFFNEMAPRPHNSGHYSIEGTTASQFSCVVSYLLGEPLQEPQLIAPTIMKNILGEDLDAAQALADAGTEGVYVHLYGKSESRAKRKMGHITFVGLSESEYNDKYRARFVKK